MLEEQQEARKEIFLVEEEIATPDGLKKSGQVRPARPRRPWLRLLEQGLAALLVLSIISGWLILSHLTRSGTGSPIPFSEAGVRSLGAPVATLHGDWSYVNEWSPDGHTFVALQIDRQKHELEARVVDAASGHVTVYPVLDSSWISAVDAFDPFSILQGRYLVALRKQSNTQATMVIWDIIGQHAIATRVIPARAPASQVLTPFIFTSQTEQKFAIDSPDGTVTIWDVASGKKIATCEGKFLQGQDAFPRGTWYDHDRIFLLSNTSPLLKSSNQLIAWNATTGARLFSMSDSHKVFSSPMISPDNRYLLLPIGIPRTSDNGRVSTASPDTLEILDAHSGKLLHSYQVGGNTGFSWQSDSRHLLAISTQLRDNAITSSGQIARWDALTGQISSAVSFSNAAYSWSIPGGQYVILGDPDGKVIHIWQVSVGRYVASVATPGIYANSYSYTATSDRYMLIGLKGNFDIWELATGKLVYKYHSPAPFSAVNAFWSPNGKYLTMIAQIGSSPDSGLLAIWRMP